MTSVDRPFVEGDRLSFDWLNLLGVVPLTINLKVLLLSCIFVFTFAELLLFDLRLRLDGLLERDAVLPLLSWNESHLLLLSLLIFLLKIVHFVSLLHICSLSFTIFISHVDGRLEELVLLLDFSIVGWIPRFANDIGTNLFTCETSLGEGQLSWSLAEIW